MKYVIIGVNDSWGIDWWKTAKDEKEAEEIAAAKSLDYWSKGQIVVIPINEFLKIAHNIEEVRKNEN